MIKKRYEIASLTSQNSAIITRTTGDLYGATYAISFKQDDIITITYDEKGVYRVTINTVANDGTEYINIEHSEKNGWHYLDDQKKIEWTFTENDVSWADGSVQLPVFHTKRGYRLIHMVVNGVTLASGAEDGQREVPLDTGISNGITTNAGNLSVTTVMESKYTTKRGEEAGCSCAYSINIKDRAGKWKDYNFSLVPHDLENQAMTVRLITDGRRSGEGLDVVMWDPDTQKLIPVNDNDSFDMSPVGTSSVTSLKTRRVRIFFQKQNRVIHILVMVYSLDIPMVIRQQLVQSRTLLVEMFQKCPKQRWGVTKDMRCIMIHGRQRKLQHWLGVIQSLWQIRE